MADRRGRELGLIAVLAVAGAGLAALAASLTWWSADYNDALTGPLTIEVSGSTAVPELVPVALVGLAGFGAALATRGVLRRLVGVVIALCGIVVAVRSAMLFGQVPAAVTGDLTRPADPVGSAVLHPLGPVLGVFAGLLLAVAGVMVLAGAGSRQRLGSRYDAPARGAAAATGAGQAAGTPSPAADPADWWKVLDAGEDPTDQPNGSPTVSNDTSGGGYHDPNTSRQT